MDDQTSTKAGERAGECPFCPPDSGRVLIENQYAVALRDMYPVSAGHTLIIPRRHVRSIFDLQPCEQAAIWNMVAEARAFLIRQFGSDGFNLGLNDGEAAGQTVGHAHVHLIPRRKGDQPDPRGGVRNIFPGRARYWEG